MKSRKYFILITALLFSAVFSFASCTQSIENKSLEEQFTDQDMSIVENENSFHILSDTEKHHQRCLRISDSISPMPIVDWSSTSPSCSLTAEEFLQSVKPGDDLSEMYERIGLPQMRYYDNPKNLTRSSNPSFTVMYYHTSDQYEISVSATLAGCTEDTYRYVINGIAAYSLEDDTCLANDQLDFNAKVSLEVIPKFLAVERKGLDYLLENNLITQAEVPYYTAEQAVYEAAQAELAVEDTQPALSE